MAEPKTTVVISTLRKRVLKWSLTTADHTGAAFEVPEDYGARSVQIKGSLGGGTLIFEGTNEPVAPSAWGNLVEIFDALGVKAVATQTYLCRPRLLNSTAGAVDVLLYVNR